MTDRRQEYPQQTANPATDIGNDRESAPIVCPRDFGRVTLFPHQPAQRPST
jgi:hypothetical protein